MLTGERAAINQIPNGESRGTVGRIQQYYHKSQSYLTGPLGGTCHFGYTDQGERFELDTALRSMEMLLGQTLALPQGSTVLDAGCGYGRVAATLSERFGYNIIGIDLMQERLMEARRYTTAHDVSERADLLRGSYCALPLKDSSVSGVYTRKHLYMLILLRQRLVSFGGCLSQVEDWYLLSIRCRIAKRLIQYARE